jgi:hypothetical protein
MSILKLIAFILIVMFVIAALRIALSVFRFFRLVRKVRGTAQEQTDRSNYGRKERAHETKSSRGDKTVTLGKDDYHVE